ncbi:hypothetical protein FP2506_02989 [Fulvimarina pelagi HTCC2506]|uniref:DUF1499 domain-containing protein n=2 Tax=Fulvimarina pelagi TaxID=217511 RepID=Q0G0D5_9HYPH|nr:DUF1499 domain-containing protein [Fulvimarina pelagi]EAU40658.1 hypothetical protein FP2506_02989 [Fulvimarina pelagi HTCC2506]BAT31202.1 hypothetical protein [Fulvimarina pelagi]
MSRQTLFLPAQGHFVRPRLGLAKPAKKLAWFGLTLFLVGIPLYRLGGISTTALTATLSLSCAMLIVALVVGLTGMARAWFQAARGGSSAFGAAFIAFIGLLPFAFIAMLAAENPATNIAYTGGFATTETAGDGASGSQPVTVAAAAAAIPARRYAAPPVEVVEAARTAALDSGWRIEEILAVDAEDGSDTTDDPLGVIRDSGAVPLPTPRDSVDTQSVDDRLDLPVREAYDVEATASDWLLGLPSDVTVRILAEGNGTIVDVRAASREIAYDFGQNRRFIESFFTALDLAMAGEEDVSS